MTSSGYLVFEDVLMHLHCLFDGFYVVSVKHPPIHDGTWQFIDSSPMMVIGQPPFVLIIMLPQLTYCSLPRLLQDLWNIQFWFPYLNTIIKTIINHVRLNNLIKPTHAHTHIFLWQKNKNKLKLFSCRFYRLSWRTYEN